MVFSLFASQHWQRRGPVLGGSKKKHLNVNLWEDERKKIGNFLLCGSKILSNLFYIPHNIAIIAKNDINTLQTHQLRKKLRDEIWMQTGTCKGCCNLTTTSVFATPSAWTVLSMQKESQTHQVVPPTKPTIGQNKTPTNTHWSCGFLYDKFLSKWCSTTKNVPAAIVTPTLMSASIPNLMQS